MNCKWENCSHYERDLRARTVDLEYQRAEFLARPSVMLGLIPFKDGNKWSVLLGENLMIGIAGFGDSPDEAMKAFDSEFYKKEEFHHRITDALGGKISLKKFPPYGLNCIAFVSQNNSLGTHKKDCPFAIKDVFVNQVEDNYKCSLCEKPTA